MHLEKLVASLTGEKTKEGKVQFVFTSKKTWALKEYLTTTTVTSTIQFVRLFSLVKYEKGYPVNKIFSLWV